MIFIILVEVKSRHKKDACAVVPIRSLDKPKRVVLFFSHHGFENSFTFHSPLYHVFHATKNEEPVFGL